jgi:hypothetical protein
VAQQNAAGLGHEVGLGFIRVGKDGKKFFASPSSNGIASASSRRNGTRNVLEDDVTRPVSKIVIDGFEVIEIEQEDALTSTKEHEFIQSVAKIGAQLAAIHQPSLGIEKGHLLQLNITPLQLLAPGNVAEHLNGSRGMILAIHDRYNSNANGGRTGCNRVKQAATLAYQSRPGDHPEIVDGQLAAGASLYAPSIA